MIFCITHQLIKVNAYSLQQLFDKNLFFLLPFYIFNLEDDFPKYNKDKKALESLKSVYVDFMLRLEKAVDDGLISAYYRRTILDMSKKVLENLAAKYKNVKKGVNDIMGGRVLEHEGKTIYNASIKEGIAVGEERGRREEKFDTARRLRQAGISDAQIQQFTNFPFEDLSLL